MRKMTGWVAAFLVPVSIAVGGIAPVGAATVVSAEIATPAPLPISKSPGALPAPTGRLKFKSAGPVCLCGDGGLSERDIEQALAKLKAEKVAGQDLDVGANQAGSPERTPNLGVAK